MNISIKAQPDFSEIPNLSQNLQSQDIVKLLNAASINIEKLNPLQLLYVVELATFTSEHKAQAFALIKLFIETRPFQELNMLLQLEMHLASRMLKKFENQESYAEFYSIFDTFYKSRIVNSDFERDSTASGILFFVHSPVFLAHTNPLFQILENRTYDLKVSIASLSSSDVFTRECDRLNVEFIPLQGDTVVERLRQLEQHATQYEHLVWQCMPAYLSYVSARIPIINWWSFKFNPPISNIKKCITSLPSKDEFVEINDNVWHNFSPTFNLKNKNKTPVEWRKRKGVLGAFCREELIDDERYWATLSQLLSSNADLSFQYCGRSEIHEKWVRKFGINPDQIKFVGWLSNPQQEMLNVAAILDTFTIRHGMMGAEAMASGIPIIYPVLEENFGGLEDLYKRLPDPDNIDDPREYASFKSMDEATNLIRSVVLDKSLNEKIGTKQRQLIDAFPKEDFEKLVACLECKELKNA